MTPRFPSPDTIYPVTFPDGSCHTQTVFLSAVLDHPRIVAGAYSYASSHDHVENWASRLAPYLYPNSPERLIIGKFCQIAHGVTFVTASANHRRDGFSTYPFAIFNGMDPERPSMPEAGPDTRIGHDVWFGAGATILPGARIGNGVIVGAGAVVSGKVPSYTVVGGNPARILRHRFPPQIAQQLINIAWWDWPIERILAAEELICGADIDALLAIASDDGPESGGGKE